MSEDPIAEQVAKPVRPKKGKEIKPFETEEAWLERMIVKCNNRYNKKPRRATAPIGA